MESFVCRICKCSRHTEVINLGTQIITSRFPDIGDMTTPSTKIRLVMCDDCQLVQLKDTTPCSELYGHMYGYRSGLNEMMRIHLQNYNTELQTFVSLTDGDSVLDIGSNDATFLHCYNPSLQRIGCDPTGNQFAECYGSAQLIPEYFTKQTIHNICGPNMRFKAVSSISMFYDLPDPVQFAKDIYDLLAEDGVWTLEQSYVATMLERNSIDTICHEHLEYYGVKQIVDIMNRAGFKILHISTNNCNGGSFRIYVAKNSSPKKAAHELVKEYLDNEQTLNIHTHARYAEFHTACTVEVDTLTWFIRQINADNKKVYIYGASTKGNCLLQFANIGPDQTPYAVERNPCKFGKMTSTGIPIISEETMRANKPEYLLVMPWHFRDGIIAREQDYLAAGGQLIFPFPKFEIYSTKPRMLITGVHGQIANYLRTQLTDSIVYGISNKKNTPMHDTTVFVNGVYDKDNLSTILRSVRPAYIIHLASITNTDDCETNIANAIQCNGIFAVNLCDIIHTHKLGCKLFNASSSELYNNHADYTVCEDDVKMAPTTIYGFAKMLSHNVVDVYRKKHDMPFSNGVIFTTESRYRKSNFLTKKIANHAREWHTTHTMLVLGSLDSYRMLTHAEDVASAILCILEQTVSGNYNICSDIHEKIETIVFAIYKRFDIHLEKHGNLLHDAKTSLPVIEITNMFHSTFKNIRGESKKLRNLGWVPRYSLDAMLDDICAL